MNLTEGQLFTIEALNRIEGFSWPDGAEFATFDRGYTSVNFWTDKPTANNPKFFGPLESSVYVNAYHPDWRNSLITREQFDSVDGWVRNDGNEPVSGVSGYCRVDVKHENGIIDLGFSSDGYEWDWQGDNEYRIVAWRYHKPTKEAEMKDTEAFQPPIHETYYRHKVQRTVTENLRKMLDESMEKEDKLLEQIKAWNLEYGFDIRVLDESDEVPDAESELVITDWRDLRVGDVIWVGPSKAPCDEKGGECVIISEEIDWYSSGDRIFLQPFKVKRGDAEFDPDIGCRGWKFIRRPSK